MSTKPTDDTAPVHPHGSTAEIDAVMDSMQPIVGEVREVFRCGICGQVYGRRYIPFGIGEGLTVNPCLCVLTKNERSNHWVLRTKQP